MYTHHVDLIYDFCNKSHINKFSINNNGSVNIYETVYIRTPMTKLPFEFNYVLGDFDVAGIGLESLIGFPKTIHGTLIMSYNNIRSLVGLPLEIRDDLITHRNPIIKDLLNFEILNNTIFRHLIIDDDFNKIFIRHNAINKILRNE